MSELDIGMNYVSDKETAVLFYIGRNVKPNINCEFCKDDPPMAEYRMPGMREDQIYTCYAHIEFALNRIRFEISRILGNAIDTKINELIDSEPARAKGGFEYIRRKVNDK